MKPLRLAFCALALAAVACTASTPEPLPTLAATDQPAVTATFVEEVLETSAAPTRTPRRVTATLISTATDIPPSATDAPTRTPRPTATDAPPTNTLAPAFTATSIPPTQPPLPTQALLPTDVPPPPTQPPLPTQPPNLGYTCSNGEACIKGNISSDGRRLYHYPGCPSYNQTQIDVGAGERWFNNEAEAQAAGWVRAGNC